MRRISFFFICLLLLSACDAFLGPAGKTKNSSKPSFAGGKGTLSTPYQIGSPNHLQNIKKCLDCHYVQKRDIDLTYFSLNQEQGWKPITNFSGSYNGQNYKIKGLSIKRNNDDSTMPLGLFGVVKNAQLSFIILENPMIFGNSNTQSIGALVGQIKGENPTTIHRCQVKEVILIGQDNLGGLVGEVNENDPSSPTLLMLNESFVENGFMIGKENIGGLVGFINNDTITNSYANNISLQGQESIGGLIGFLNGNGNIANSYAACPISGEDKLGGLVGEIFTSANITQSYYDKTISGQSDNKGEPKDTAQMQNPDTFDSWDNNIWSFPPNSYPILK